MLHDLPSFHFDTMFDVYRSVQGHIRKVLNLGQIFFQTKCIFTKLLVLRYEFIEFTCDITIQLYKFSVKRLLFYLSYTW
ncbi:hypothetical protein Hanom_Chr14g01311921 [Helianthus anomalus]